jgi:hypothetical protein
MPNQGAHPVGSDTLSVNVFGVSHQSALTSPVGIPSKATTNPGDGGVVSDMTWAYVWQFGPADGEIVTAACVWKSPLNMYHESWEKRHRTMHYAMRCEMD